MDARLLRYYNQELRYLREQGAEFAEAFPKIAARLGIEGLEVSDPYVERLLEACAFLAGRVQLKLDAEFPRLSHRLLDLLYPAFLAPMPAMLVIQARPVPDPNLLKGHALPRDQVLLAPPSTLTQTRCEFRTTQALQLTPLTTAHAEYFLNVSELGLTGLNLSERPRSGVRVRLQLPAGMSVQNLAVDHLRFFLGGQTDIAMQLRELLSASCVGVLVGAPGREGDGRRRLLPPSAVQPVGHADEDAALPVTRRSLSGLRLLEEYFAFPERFLFVDVVGLRQTFTLIAGQQLELTFLLSRPGAGLEGLVTGANFELHCVPAINLFGKRADRIAIHDGAHEFHVVPDRTRPLDFEVYDVRSVTGHADTGADRRFLPLFAPARRIDERGGYFTVWREPRLVSDKARREGLRSGYVGTETFLSLVDPHEAPLAHDMRQLSLEIRCTNRDLPIFMPTGGGAAAADFLLDAGVPLAGVRNMAGPSRPHTALRDAAVAWRLLNLLSLNYLSLVDTDAGEAAEALRSLMGTLPNAGEPVIRRQIDALQSIAVRPVVRRHPIPGPIAFSRGLEIEVTLDELGHEGGSAFIFASVLHHFFTRHVSINSHVETVFRSLTRGVVSRWKPLLGARPCL
jgi:type VI secretion system protein ImpG